MKIRDIDPDKDKIIPKCPHCKQKLEEILRIKGMQNHWLMKFQGFCYLCPHCEVVLGFSDPL